MQENIQLIVDIVAYSYFAITGYYVFLFVKSLNKYIKTMIEAHFSDWSPWSE